MTKKAPSAPAVEAALTEKPALALARVVTPNDLYLMTAHGRSGWFSVLDRHGMRRHQAEIERHARAWANMRYGHSSKPVTIGEFLVDTLRVANKQESE